jgi:hypothetical protein
MLNFQSHALPGGDRAGQSYVTTPTMALPFPGDAARRPELAAVGGRVEHEHKAPTPHQEATMSQTEDQPEDEPGDGRSESVNQRMDRNWSELLQELRVTETGVQILTGFLLTVPFQQRFTTLDHFQRTVYLCLVVLAITATGLIVAPVSLHRVLFRRHLKSELVHEAGLMERGGLMALALVLAGSALLLFDIVLGRAAGVVAGATALMLLVVLWLLVPLRLTRRASVERATAPLPPSRQ